MTDYYTPAGYGEAELVEKKSRFIGHVWHVSGEDEASGLIKAARLKYADAAHNVYAYVIRKGFITRFSDDGEPGGSSGQPTLLSITGAGVTDALCVVTRYFGGTLLGRGGLVRAYSKAATMALESAGIALMKAVLDISVSCSYQHFEQARRLLENCGAKITDSDFAERVAIFALLQPDKLSEVTAYLNDITAGTAAVTTLGEAYMRSGV